MYYITKTHLHHPERIAKCTSVETLREFAEWLISVHADDDHYIIIDGCLYDANDVSCDDESADGILLPTRPALVDPADPAATYSLRDFVYTASVVIPPRQHVKKQEMITKMNRFLNAEHEDAAEEFRKAFKSSMKDYSSLATCLWIEDGEIESEEFTTDNEAIEEMEKHDVAFFVPKSWHEKRACDWIWVEKDEDPESDTFGEELWCCNSVECDDDGIFVARYMRMSHMWDKLLDWVQNDWNDEANSVMSYVAELVASLG